MSKTKPHRWVTEVKQFKDGYKVVWCADCGVHQGEVAGKIDWEKDPCPDTFRKGLQAAALAIDILEKELGAERLPLAEDAQER